ncbi:hypothetical protein [Encephalitozoon cuniculi GB-M1]|uniref:UPF0328 protein ECU03_0130 n=2 Tax=Encephalitozoon cuniculi TaxID=6035 RepID=Y313_ENCCU|nr:uncharacterized protein ECU03_0130 [Encephalitozoon cuniculi GB-M1]Q8SW74.1 RecName: Full=UPF0328 protein ECU03_0130 [Encephalitozoon cuniculi GB-M1]AGE96567.1 hypothetical protein ECU03_0130 [Encephalitozoon cuniculi]KMV66377.1 hypothetical protein M970_030050 [Encephalitozoon cuniculi EcunIII-L]UYI28003.1 DUF2463 domain-containing protein [Encephalitozoon cuniculi]CAD26160.1 hypothetical protein [Encephalitozoon cuniculi GB-M1]
MNANSDKPLEANQEISEAKRKKIPNSFLACMSIISSLFVYSISEENEIKSSLALRFIVTSSTFSYVIFSFSSCLHANLMLWKSDIKESSVTQKILYFLVNIISVVLIVASLLSIVGIPINSWTYTKGPLTALFPSLVLFDYLASSLLNSALGAVSLTDSNNHLDLVLLLLSSFLITSREWDNDFECSLYLSIASSIILLIMSLEDEDALPSTEEPSFVARTKVVIFTIVLLLVAIIHVFLGCISIGIIVDAIKKGLFSMHNTNKRY